MGRAASSCLYVWCSVFVVASAVAAGGVGVGAAVAFAVFSGDVAVVVAQG